MSDAVVSWCSRALATMFITLASVAHAGCARGGHHEVVTSKPRTPHLGGVQIVRASDSVPLEFQPVALIQALSSGEAITSGSLVTKLADRARALGCNAVVRVEVAFAREGREGVAMGVAGVLSPKTPPPRAD